MRGVAFLLLLIGAHAATLDKTGQDNVLAHVNKYRRAHQAPDVVYSADISEVSQAWADRLAESGQFMHSTTNYGENLAMFYGSSTNSDQNFVKMSIDNWYSEVKDYDYNKPGYSSQTGHFTQLVWVATKTIGVGVARGSSGIYVVMNYDPPGNYIGAFEKNVFPLGNNNTDSPVYVPKKSSPSPSSAVPSIRPSPSSSAPSIRPSPPVIATLASNADMANTWHAILVAVLFMFAIIVIEGILQ